jgi:hypothetical protein
MADDINDIYRCTPRQIKQFSAETIEAGMVPMTISSPGMGKSSIYHQIAQDYNLELIDHRLSTSSPEDLSGLPTFDDNGGLSKKRATFLPFDLFPLEDTPVPKGKDGWLLFLDEVNAASKSVQAASYKLVLDKKVGQHNLHPRCAMAMAGNLATDKAIVNPMSTAMVSRLVTFEMQIHFGQFIEDVAIPRSFDERIIAYLHYKEDHLMDFNPDREGPFCCPRTWEFMDKHLKTYPVSQDRTAKFAGTITPGVAASFVQFCAVRDQMIDFKTILSDPLGTKVPEDSPGRWMVISHIMDKVDEKTFTAASTYANRFPIQFRVLFFRSAMIRHPELRQHPSFAPAMGELSRYLNS